MYLNEDIYEPASQIHLIQPQISRHRLPCTAQSIRWRTSVPFQTYVLILHFGKTVSWFLPHPSASYQYHLHRYCSFNSHCQVHKKHRTHLHWMVKDEWQREDTWLCGNSVRCTTALFTYFPLFVVLRGFVEDGELAPELKFEEPHLSLLHPPNKNIYKETRRQKAISHFI